MGGGMGLAAACDICIASTTASFATSEVKLGIIPAVISPYVVRAIGERQSYRYFQTAEKITAARAYQIGLAHEVVAPEQLDEQVGAIVAALLAGGPMAQARSEEHTSELQSLMRISYAVFCLKKKTKTTTTNNTTKK